MSGANNYYITIKAQRELINKIRKIAEKEERTILVVLNRVLKKGIESYINEKTHPQNPASKNNYLN